MSEQNETPNTDLTANDAKLCVSGSAFEEDYFDEDFWDGQPLESCPNCGRMYDDIGFDYQYCKCCGWDAENEKFDKPLKPTQQDFMSGDADILTGQWY